MPRNIGNIKPYMRCPYGKKPRQIPSNRACIFHQGCEVEPTKAAMPFMDKRGLKLLRGKQIFIHCGIQSLGFAQRRFDLSVFEFQLPLGVKKPRRCCDAGVKFDRRDRLAEKIISALLKGVQHLGFGRARGKQNKINIQVWGNLAQRVT